VEFQAFLTWYLDFLEFKMVGAWNNLFCQVLGCVDKPMGAPSSDDLSVGFGILEVVIQEQGRQSLALIDIVDKLYNLGLLRTTDHMRSHANQLVFTLFGWLSMFKYSDWKRVALCILQL